MFRQYRVLSALLVSIAITSLPAGAVQRSFVASFGSDANTASNCGFTNPCRGFTAALTVTDPGGEIVALDAAGYGAVTINKSVTLTSNSGFYAGIAAASGNAVTIATAGVNVTLRGLNINGIGATNGVLMTNGNRLSIENCVISNFSTGTGVLVQAAATVRVVDSIVRENGTGVDLQNGANGTISGSKFFGHTGSQAIRVFSSLASTTTIAAVSDSIISGNYVAIEVGANLAGTTARVFATNVTIMNNYYGFTVDGLPGTQTGTISNSMATGNNYGLYTFGGTLESLGNNNVRQNGGANTVGTITTVPGT